MAQIVEDDIEGELFTTDSIALAAFTVDLYIDEHLHLGVEVQDSGLLRSTGICPDSLVIDKVLVGAGPRVDWGEHRVIKGRKLSGDKIHLVEVLWVGVVDVLKNEIGWGTSVSIVVQ